MKIISTNPHDWRWSVKSADGLYSNWQAQKRLAGTKKTCRLKYIENSSNMDFLVLLVGSCESERVGMVIIINKVNKEDC